MQVISDKMHKVLELCGSISLDLQQVLCVLQVCTLWLNGGTTPWGCLFPRRLLNLPYLRWFLLVAVVLPGGRFHLSHISSDPPDPPDSHWPRP